jgi:hypothetical protein
MALTVAEIAELIRRQSVDTSKVIERLRAWSDIGLLEPVGERNPGTGVKRVYNEEAVYAAGILNGLADIGVAIGRQRHAIFVLDVAHRARVEWAKKRRGGLWLEIAEFDEADPGQVTHAVFFHADREKDHIGKFIHPGAEGAIVLNVSRLFQRIEQRKKATAKRDNTVRGKRPRP